MKIFVNLLNQIFEVEKKLQNQPAWASVQRNIERMRNELEEAGYTMHNPLNEKYDATRSDCEATIAGNASAKLTIVQVIKPIIYQKKDGAQQMVQKAVVIAGS